MRILQDGPVFTRRKIKSFKSVQLKEKWTTFSKEISLGQILSNKSSTTTRFGSHLQYEQCHEKLYQGVSSDFSLTGNLWDQPESDFAQNPANRQVLFFNLLTYVYLKEFSFCPRKCVRRSSTENQQRQKVFGIILLERIQV